MKMLGSAQIKVHCQSQTGCCSPYYFHLLFFNYHFISILSYSKPCSQSRYIALFVKCTRCPGLYLTTYQKLRRAAACEIFFFNYLLTAAAMIH